MCSAVISFFLNVYDISKQIDFFKSYNSYLIYLKSPLIISECNQFILLNLFINVLFGNVIFESI